MESIHLKVAHERSPQKIWITICGCRIRQVGRNRSREITKHESQVSCHNCIQALIVQKLGEISDLKSKLPASMRPAGENPNSVSMQTHDFDEPGEESERPA